MDVGTDENAVYERTAKYFGANRQDIKITNFTKGPLDITYQVTYAGAFYNCYVYLDTVNCKQAGGPGPQGNSGTTEHATASSEPKVESTVEASKSTQPMTLMQAQTRLNQLGYPVGVADGLTGKKTTQQLKAFQKSKGLTVTGKLDEATASALQAR